MLTDKEELRQKAKEIKNKFDTVIASYAEVHKHISNTNTITQEAQGFIQEKINIFMTNYKTLIGKNVIPKMHILENHVMPFVENFNVSLGRLAE